MILYNGSKSRVRVAGGLSDEFEIGVGVHQGSVLSPLLFILIMEEATKSCASGGPWELLQAQSLSWSRILESGSPIWKIEA